jgi:hypothetical protein
MYQDILKEIGAKEANMDYLFDDTSDDDDDLLLHDEEEQVPAPPKEALQTLLTSESRDDELLHQCESDEKKLSTVEEILMDSSLVLSHIKSQHSNCLSEN